MIGIEFVKGMGLGNRLFCYVSTRCIAEDHHTSFGTAGWQYMNADFLDLDPGIAISDPAAMKPYAEAEKRLYLTTSPHDMVHGCYVAGADPALVPEECRSLEKGETLVSGEDSHLPEGNGLQAKGINAFPEGDVLLSGNLQAQAYFSGHKAEIRNWLRVKPEYESLEYTADDLCILNVRGGEYAGDPALFLRKRYWVTAMRHMRRIRPDMRFLIVTDDPESAAKLLPGIEVHHFSPAKDYVTLKNARHLILSNSSFAFFPAYTSETVQDVIAPKYWARHNVSDGYWASAQNIYDGFSYLGRDGKLYSAEACRRELAGYHYPETQPWEPDDPAVERVRKRNERIHLLTMAIHKAERVAKRKLR